ncbi:hypothetical protein [Pedobacter rhodius]|uniref:Outer membrane protein beta-barrel domain-containing protein n=1 Tax=Pedobacter rhodius TaxID=3004098 RepID=A0ABT4KXH4_9SPHI|nr:hypothetical protein [Pedobacter sp. SJ11]MCZ4223625.1 hypothetical protein [Pedobacter sp. SJ11]
MFKSSLILSGAILFLSFAAKAQHAKIGIGAEAGFPSGNFSGLSSVGAGASLKAEFPLSKAFSIIVNGGIMNFFGRNNQLLSVQDLTYAPLKAGLKYQLSETFYAEGQLGAALPLNNGQKTLFAWSPGLGNLFNLPGKHMLDLGIRYEGWTGKNESLSFLNRSNTKGFIGIRFAYIFGL